MHPQAVAVDGGHLRLQGDQKVLPPTLRAQTRLVATEWGASIGCTPGRVRGEVRVHDDREGDVEVQIGVQACTGELL